MGEIAEMFLDGTLCERCGDFLDGETPEYPRLCARCQLELEEDEECSKTTSSR